MTNEWELPDLHAPVVVGDAPAEPTYEQALAFWAAVSRLARAAMWQPIATAPKDGTEALVYDAGAIVIALWSTEDGQSGWWDNGIMNPSPTHWMPLPAPPEAEP